MKHLYDLACQDRRRLENLIIKTADYINANSSLDATGEIARLITEEADAIRKEGR